MFAKINLWLKEKFSSMKNALFVIMKLSIIKRSDLNFEDCSDMNDKYLKNFMSYLKMEMN